MVPIEIILFEANKNLRQSLTHLLGSSGVFAVTGSYGNCSDAFYIAKNFKPHAVLLDIDMPGESAIRGVMKVKEANPNTYIIIYAVFEDGDRLFKCLCAGACGYLLKKKHPSKIVDGICEAMNGSTPISPNIVRKILEAFKKKKSSKEFNLSPRETELLQLLLKGYSLKMVSTQLKIPFDTGRSHLTNIYQKLHVNFAGEAIASKLKEKII